MWSLSETASALLTAASTDGHQRAALRGIGVVPVLSKSAAMEHVHGIVCSVAAFSGSSPERFKEERKRPEKGQGNEDQCADKDRPEVDLPVLPGAV